MKKSNTNFSTVNARASERPRMTCVTGQLVSASQLGGALEIMLTSNGRSSVSDMTLLLQSVTCTFTLRVLTLSYFLLD